MANYNKLLELHGRRGCLATIAVTFLWGRRWTPSDRPTWNFYTEKEAQPFRKGLCGTSTDPEEGKRKPREGFSRPGGCPFHRYEGQTAAMVRETRSAPYIKDNVETCNWDKVKQLLNTRLCTLSRTMLLEQLARARWN